MNRVQGAPRKAGLEQLTSHYRRSVTIIDPFMWSRMCFILLFPPPIGGKKQKTKKRYRYVNATVRGHIFLMYLLLPRSYLWPASRRN